MSQIEKLNSRTDEWNAIYPFIEWLHVQDMTIAEYSEETNWGDRYLYPLTLSIENLLYKYFDINTHQLEMERREILRKLSEQHDN